MVNNDILSGLAILGLACLGLFQSQDFTYYGGVFVSWVLVILAALGGLILAKGVLKGEKLHFWTKGAQIKQVILSALILVAYAFLLPTIGFIASSIAMFFALCLLLSSPEARRSARTWFYALIAGCSVTLLFFAVFHYALLVPLPVGRLFAG